MARNPEVGRTSVKDYFEGLSWSSDFDLSIVLGIHGIVDYNILTTVEGSEAGALH